MTCLASGRGGALLVGAFLALGLAGLCLPMPASAGASPPLPADEAFRSRYQALREAAAEGAVSEETRREATRLWLSLQHFLVDADAAVEELKWEVRRTTGEAQEDALRRLVAAVAERERVAARHLRDLECVVAGAPGTEFSPVAAPAPPPPDRGPGGDEATVKLRFGPEDLTRTRME